MRVEASRQGLHMAGARNLNRPMPKPDPVKRSMDRIEAVMAFDWTDVKDKKTGRYLELGDLPRETRLAMQKAEITQTFAYRGPVKVAIGQECKYELLSPNMLKTFESAARTFIKLEKLDERRSSAAPYIKKADWMKDVEERAAKYGGKVVWP